MKVYGINLNAEPNESKTYINGKKAKKCPFTLYMCSGSKLLFLFDGKIIFVWKTHQRNERKKDLTKIYFHTKLCLLINGISKIRWFSPRYYRWGTSFSRRGVRRVVELMATWSSAVESRGIKMFWRVSNDPDDL